MSDSIITIRRPGCRIIALTEIKEEEKPDLLLNGQAARGLGAILRRGEEGIKDFPRALEGFLRSGSWRRRIIPDRPDSAVEFDSFENFVQALPLEGLGARLRDLRNLCRDCPAVLAMLDQAVQRPAGNPTGANQHTEQKLEPFIPQEGAGRCSRRRRHGKRRLEPLTMYTVPLSKSVHLGTLLPGRFASSAPNRRKPMPLPKCRRSISAFSPGRSARTAA